MLVANSLFTFFAVIMDFYEPTFLFRQNAIKRPGSDAGSSMYSSTYTHSNKSSSSWLLNNSNSSDVQLLNKACSLDRLNIKSNYWKIPDANMYLTALASSSQNFASPLLAISSANTESNLFIYELDSLNHYLTHHTTISLPNVHGLAWVPNTHSRFLVSGNSKGYAHLVSVPLPKSYTGETEDESAEIVKRFNHRKHLRAANKDPSIFSHTDTCISKLGFTSSNNLVSIYDGTLFVWNMNECESSMRPSPERISVIPGLADFDTPATNPHTLAVCGSFGVSLFDTRNPTHSIPKATLDRKLLSAHLIKWSPNEHIMAAAHGDGMVRLWDIRKQDTFACLTGHQNKKVLALEWNKNDLFTGASDGNIVHWDLSSDLGGDLADHAESILRCSMKEGISSVSFDSVKNSLVQSVSERQCGTLLPALNNTIVGMCLVSDSDGLNCKIVSIDGSSFLGLHSKIYEVDAISDKAFYSCDDLALIAKEEHSNTTLVGSTDSLKPLLVPGQINPLLLKTLSTDASVHSDDFNFWPDSVLVVSVPLSEGELSSPDSLCLNDSVDTLSTTATIVESPLPGHGKNTLLSFLDGELERISSAFNDNYYRTDIRA